MYVSCKRCSSSIVQMKLTFQIMLIHNFQYDAKLILLVDLDELERSFLKTVKTTEFTVTSIDQHS